MTSLDDIDYTDTLYKYFLKIFITFLKKLQEYNINSGSRYLKI